MKWKKFQSRKPTSSWTIQSCSIFDLDSVNRHAVFQLLSSVINYKNTHPYNSRYQANSDVTLTIQTCAHLQNERSTLSILSAGLEICDLHPKPTKREPAQNNEQQMVRKVHAVMRIPAFAWVRMFWKRMPINVSNQQTHFKLCSPWNVKLARHANNVHDISPPCHPPARHLVGNLSKRLVKSVSEKQTNKTSVQKRDQTYYTFPIQSPFTTGREHRGNILRPVPTRALSPLGILRNSVILSQWYWNKSSRAQRQFGVGKILHDRSILSVLTCSTLFLQFSSCKNHKRKQQQLKKILKTEKHYLHKIHQHKKSVN